MFLREHLPFGFISPRKMPLHRLQRLLAALAIIFLASLCVYYVGRSHPDWSVKPLSLDCPSGSFVRALASRASPDRFVILAMVDAPFVDMAVNMYESSFRPNGIQNFLFVAAGRRACEVLVVRHSLPCYHYADDEDSEMSSVYGSPAFVRKMNIRTDMILDALNAGFAVLHTDLDVAFLKDPIPELKAILAVADIAALWDSTAFNAGFVAIRPSLFAKMVYERTKAITLLNEKMNDQSALNVAINSISRINQKKGFKVVALDTSRYLCGFDYFEKGNRSFPATCSNCSVVHNNWIVSREAKVFRFKEHFMWHYDANGYYTSPDRRYIAYDNPVVWDDEGTSIAEELGALKAALAYGQLLDRIVILPRFHCGDPFSGPEKRKPKGNETATTKSPLRPISDCPLNSLVKIAAFDSAFADRYRESSFLSHPLVPESVRRDLSAPYVVLDNRIYAVKDGDGQTSGVTEPLGSYDSKEQLLSMLSSSKRVLRFHSLYGATPSFLSQADQREFERKIKAAFQPAQYRQF